MPRSARPRAAGDEEGAEPVGAGTLMLHPRGGADVAAVRLGTHYEVHVSGPIARTRVVQAFRNTGRQWGPLPGFRRAREVVRRLNDAFRLFADCPRPQEMVFAEQEELFPVERRARCLRLDLAACLGPCAGACTRSAYREQARQCTPSWRGATGGCWRRLDRDMAGAAAALQFERAAACATGELIDWLDRCLARFARRELSLVYPVPGVAAAELWCALRRGRVVAVLDLPDAAGAAAHGRAAGRAVPAAGDRAAVAGRGGRGLAGRFVVPPLPGGTGPVLGAGDGGRHAGRWSRVES